MTLYPCTKQPPCTNVSGHRTPVCPELTTKSSGGNTSTSKLKDDIMNTGSKVKPDPDTKWVDNPQAIEINALIEHASRLDDCLNNTWVAWDNAWDNAETAAKAAGRDDAWDDVIDDTFGAIDYVAWYTVKDTACALVARDLINENTDWNQEAYDLLTEPWVKVIGPAHPDDEVQ